MIKGTVEIPKHYFFQMAIKDYRHWQKALWREFFQNSIDAGASKIKIASDIHNNSVTIIDNGSGMTLDVLQNKLFCLGGSHKKQGAVGAFGKAKELLFFSWPSYYIKTGDFEVKGKYNEYIIEDLEDYYSGTRCTITLPKNDVSVQTLLSYGREVASLMETSCQIIFDGQLVETGWRRGNLVQDLGWCQIFHDIKEQRTNYLRVRVAGIWMFDVYVGAGIGAVTVELTKNSIDCLTSNRDGLQDRYQQELDMFIKRLIADTQQALKPTPVITRRIYEGAGAINIATATGALNTGLDQLSNNVMDEGLVALAKSMQNILNLQGFMSELTANRFAQVGVIAKNDGDIERWSFDYKDRMAFIGYQPDFATKYESDKETYIEKFMKTKKATLLIKMWTEVVKEVMLTSGHFVTFTAGFIFEDGVEAQLEQRDGQYFVYLNPDLVLSNTAYKSAIFKKRRVLIEDLKDKAIHEIAHIRCDYHDENFVNQMAKIRSTTYDSYFAYQTIQKIK